MRKKVDSEEGGGTDRFLKSFILSLFSSAVRKAGLWSGNGDVGWMGGGRKGGGRG